MTESQSLVTEFASTTGALMTDASPILLYLFGLVMVCIFMIMISRIWKPLKNIFKV